MTSPQRSVIQSANNSISVKFGFLGLGMGGSSIAAACAETQTNITNNRFPYTSLLVNTNKMDLDKIVTQNPNTKKLIIGDGKGAGRNIEQGEKMFKEANETLIKEMKLRFEGTDFVWVVAGLGGGTGTGSVIEAIKLLMQNGFNKRFGLILTLPRVNEGQTVLSNALQRLQMINKAMNGLGSIILVDNQKLYDHFSKNKPGASVAEYLQFTNKYVADTLHELNVVTSSFKPYGENHFDSSEFVNLIKTPGILHFARFTTHPREIDSAQTISHIGRLKEQIEDGVLSDSYNLKNSTRLAVSILANKSTAARLFNFEFANAIENQVNEIAPFSNEKPIAQYVYDDRETTDVYFYAVFAGLQLPKRVSELVQETTKLIEQQKQQQTNTEDIFAGLSTGTTESSNQEQSFEDLFGAKEEPVKEKSPTEDSVFEGLFGKN
jgi:cell division GTPase FtsZ